MSRLHLRHTTFPALTGDAAKHIIDNRPWSFSEDRTEIVQSAFNMVFGLVAPTVSFIHDNEFGLRVGFRYTPPVRSALGLSSMPADVRFCRQFSTPIVLAALHAHQAHLDDESLIEEVEMTQEDFEFGCSLHYRVAPSAFRAAARKGKVRGVTAKDTFTTENWEKLEEEGLTYGNDLAVSAHSAVYLLQHGELPSTISASGSTAEETTEADEDTPEVEAVSDETDEVEIFDLIRSQNLTVLRKLSRGRISGGYSMPKSALIQCLLDEIDLSNVDQVRAEIAELTR